jgi:hypothetical protein
MGPLRKNWQPFLLPPPASSWFLHDPSWLLMFLLKESGGVRWSRVEIIPPWFLLFSSECFLCDSSCFLVCSSFQQRKQEEYMRNHGGMKNEECKSL